MQLELSRLGYSINEILLSPSQKRAILIAYKPEKTDSIVRTIRMNVGSRIPKKIKFRIHCRCNSDVTIEQRAFVDYTGEK